MEPGRLWLLNLDAEEELARPVDYAPGRSLRRAVAARRERAHCLFDAGDVECVDDGSTPASASGGDPLPGRGREGVAWCPTPRALEVLRAHGATPPMAPSLDVLVRANDRAFACGLGLGLPGTRMVSNLGEVRDALAEGGAWLAKASLSAAGRGKRRLEGALDAADEAFFARAWPNGAFLLEPFADIEAEFALHGRIDPRGGCAFGRACVQVCDAQGVWQETRAARAGELDASERRALDRAGERAAAALIELGYHGPFGIDAWRGRVGGARVFQSLSEINARYSMGYAVGFGRVECVARSASDRR